MGKKKQDKRRVKLPKRIAGIKLPKELRHGGEAVLTQVRDHVGAELLVAGAALAATALRPSKTPAAAPADPSPAPFDAEAFGRAAGLVATVATGALAALAKQKPEKD